MITIQVFFTNLGVPATGLTPKITILNTLTSAIVINAASCPEVGLGFYYYNFTFDSNLIYSVYIDGGSSLSNSERYKFASVPDVGQTLVGGVG